MINIFFRFWKSFSILILTMVFLFCYSNLPDSIAYLHKENGTALRFMDKQNFFYWTAGVLFFFNLLMALLNGQLGKVNFKSLFSNSIWAQHPTALKSLLSGWCNAFVALTNTFLVFVLLGLNNINANDNQKLDFNYNWLLILGAIILMLVIFSLPLRLLFSSPRNHEN